MEAYQQLEVQWAAWNGLDPAGMVACSSGTSALHLALEALRLPPGSEVIVPDFTMVACARAVTLAGLTPVFVDCRDDLLMDYDCLRAAANPDKVQAVMVVHVYGRRVHLGGVRNCTYEGTFTIEDLAEAHGIRPHPSTDAACWSFYRNKIVAGEEGGAVWFRDPAHAALARQLRNLGFTDAHDFMHVPRGHNYRLANCLAEKVLKNFKTLAQVFARDPNEWNDFALKHQKASCLPLVASLVAERQQIESWYDAVCPDEWRMPPRDVPWVYDVRIPEMAEVDNLPLQLQDRLVKTLREHEVEARHAFKPMSVQEEYRGCRLVGNRNAWRLAREVFYLPISPGATTEEEVRRAFDLIYRMIKSPNS